MRRIADVSSPSLTAYRLYSEGMDAAVHLRWQEAQRRLEEATAIDPMFAEAHLRLVIIARNTGGTNRQREHLRMAAAHAHRLSARHRLLLELELAREQADVKRMPPLLDELIARFPDSVDAYQFAAALYHPTAGFFPDPEKLLSNLTLRDGAARVAVARGDLVNAIQTYRRLLSYGPDQQWVAVFEPRYVLQLARLLERAGDGQGAQEEYRRFLALWRQADADLPELAEARRALRRIE